MANPKAYIVDDRRYWDSATVVFAESAGQARSLALHTDACEDLDFTDISAKRAPKLDLAYRGVFEMDWWNDEDRLAMVRDANFYCDVGDLGRKELGCDSCVAKNTVHHTRNLRTKKNTISGTGGLTMPRYIDADAIHYVEIGKGVEIALASDIDKIPTVSLDEVRGVGKWIKRFDGPYGHGRTYCSSCGKHSGIGGIKQTPPYCPNCGAKMEVSEDA